MPFSSRLASVVVVSLALRSPLFGQGDAAYRVVQKVTVGGDGGWDYLVVDPAARRLYVTRATRVMVFDADSLKQVGEIPNTTGVHGVALAPELSRGFASNGRAGSITIFDLKTLATIEEVKIEGQNPDAILYDPPTKRVFAFNGRSADATVLDAASGKVAGTIPLGGKPEFGVAAGDGRLYANIVDSAQVVEIDPTAGRVVRRWPLAPCEEPTGLAIDRVHHLLFSGCRNKLMAISNYQAGRLVGQVPIGGGVDGDAFDPAAQLAFSSNGEGTITVVHEDSPTRFQVVGTVATRRGARTMALDERTHRIYTVTAAFGPTPAATAAEPRPRPSLVPGTFALLVLER